MPIYRLNHETMKNLTINLKNYSKKAKFQALGDCADG